MNNTMFHVRTAAERGEADAQFNLGVFYDNGLDDNGHAERRNRKEAIKWLRKAARQGLARAQCKLAEIYAEESDLMQAYAWFLVVTTKSNDANSQRAESRMSRIAPSLTADQIVHAKKLARTWSAKIAALSPN